MENRISIIVEGEKIIGIFNEPEKETNTCVITCHGLLASKDSQKYIMLSEALVLQGISSLRFDFRGCGESSGKLESSHITNRTKDLDAIVNYIVQELGINKLGLFGSSMGGFLSISLASKNSNIKALVSLAAPISISELFFANNSDIDFYEVEGFGFGREFLNDIKAHGNLSNEIINNITCPTLIFHGDLDPLVPITHAERLYNSLKSKKELKMIKGGDHIFSNPYHLNEVINSSVDWFKRYLLDGSINDQRY